MDAIVMAGGRGSRLRPLVAAPVPKHLIPVGGYPLIWHVLQMLIQGGVERIVVSLNGPHPELTLETIVSFNLTRTHHLQLQHCDRKRRTRSRRTPPRTMANTRRTVYLDPWGFVFPRPT